ncbi:winged helix-turn-helix domain-containing protein [Catellatospora vulcania]|uniref:winged helix-turn-helix domain-containing protein n=1 Tax=Catellatospora vulcania TaxID=1460450 RepID=UPI0012D444D9|nr:winged helix-turn-helix domain-containing protein [Catellatospora vulcania]
MPISPPYAANIVADIRRQISAGELKSGDQLPSLPALRDHYGCSLGSVRNALDRLKASSELISHQGIGYFVP